MSDSSLNFSINISAVDNASNVFRTVGTAISQLASGNVMGAVVTAGKAVVGAFSDSVQAASQFQQVQAQTAQTIKSTGDASGMTAQQITALAQSLSTTTPFSDTLIQSGENMLLTFTGIGKQVFPQATQAMLDMATAMHMGPTQAALQLGKALQDPATGLTALQREGVKFSASEQEQIKTMMAHNNIVGAQTIMLQELQKEFGGSAQAAGQTFAGQLQILGNQFTILQQNIGMAVMPVLTQLMEFVNSSLMPVFQGIGQFIQSDVTPAITSIGDSIGHFLSLFDLTPITYAWKQLTGAVQELFAPLNSASDVMGALMPHLVDLRNLFSQLLVGGIRNVAGVITTVANAIKGFAENINEENIESFFSGFESALGPFMADLRQFGSVLAQVLPGFISQFVRALGMLVPAFTSIAKGVSTIAGPALQVLGQILKGVQSAIEPVLNAIEGQLLPAIDHIISVVAPIIATFLKWVAASGLIPIAFSLIGNAVGIVIDIFSKLVDIGASVIGFFEHNRTAMNVLLSVLGMIALQIGSILIPQFVRMGITIFTDVIPGFIAWAIEAGIAAVETLIGFWPIIAAAALVAAAIFIVIEVIQHWGQIGAWLQAAWKAVATFFVGLWNGIVSGLKVAWNAIVNAVKVGAAFLLAAFMGPFVAIGAAFIWLYQHNTYFKELIDAITNIVKAGVAWLQGAWQAVITWIVAQWNDVVVIATAVWNQIAKAVQTAWNAAVGFVVGVWQKISAAFSSAWNTYIVGPLTALWNNVSSVFSNAWNTYIATPLTNIWNSISQWFTQLGTGAANSGKNFISMLVNGITSGVGAIWNAVASIATTMWKALGFHSPAKEGPGADADKWMPNLVNMLSAGLMAGVPKIQAAVNLVAKPLATLGSPQAATAAAGPAAASQTSTANNNIAIHVHLDGTSGPNAQKHGKDIADVVKRELARHLRQQSLAPRFTSGGTHR